MTTEDAIQHYGSAAELARALQCTRQAIAAWGERPPAARQLQLQRMTGGALVAEYEPAGAAGGDK